VSDGVELLLRVPVAIIGALIVGSTLMSAVKLVVVPRGGTQRITRSVFIAVRLAFERIAHTGRDFLQRDRWLSLYAPIALVLMPLVWFALLIAGFTLIHWSVLGGSLTAAFRVSGSSMLTLGVAFDARSVDPVLTFLQAGIGVLVGSLLISYLPSLYQSYQRRETLVGLLEARAGIPPAPDAMLARYFRIGALDLLDDDLFTRWEPWFAEVEESHTSFAALVFFRSPRPERSWITAAGTVLDTAALRLSALDLPFSGRTALCMRSGFLCLRRIADYFGIPYDADPPPDGPVSVTRAEFDDVLAALAATGLPVRADREQAWNDFRGWRVNYGTVLVALAKMIVAPDGRWSSDRPGPRFTPMLIPRRGRWVRMVPDRFEATRERPPRSRR
jgi:hypothetical protein